MDAIPLYLETATSNANIVVVFRVDGPISYRDYADGFRHDRLDRLPGFRNVVVQVALNLKQPSWREARDFALDDHLQDIQLEPPGSDRQLRALIDGWINERFDFRTPPWNIFVVNGLEGGGSALVLRMHHCLSDGIGMVKLIFPAILDGLPMPQDSTAVKAVASEAPEHNKPPPGSPQSSHCFKARMHELANAPGVQLPFRRALSGRAHHAATSFDLGDVRTIRNALGGTSNDVLLAVLGGAIDGLLETLGVDGTDHYCRILQASNARRRNERTVAGNRVAFIPVLVPLGRASPAERLARIVTYTRRTRLSGARAAADTYMRHFSRTLPPPVLKLALRLLLSPALLRLGSAIRPMPAVDMYVTHFPWTDSTAFIGERRVVGMTPLAPLLPNTGLTCAAVSYAGRMFIGLTADAVSFPQVDNFVGGMHRAFEDLHNLATHNPATRRAAVGRAPAEREEPS